MTEANMRRNIQDELARSSDCLGEADLLFEHGKYNAAISRLYYATLHGLRALLFSKGLEPKSHEGALQLLNLHFVKESRMDRETSRFFARLMKYREEADYSTSFEFTAEEYVQFRKEADGMLSAIRQYLTSNNLNP